MRAHPRSISVTIKALPAIQIAELTATAASYSPQDISRVIQPLYPELFGRLGAAGVRPAGSELAWYEPVPGRSGAVRVHAAVPVAADLDPRRDFAVLSLPPVACAATILHHGSMDEVIGTLWTAAAVPICWHALVQVTYLTRDLLVTYGR